MAACANLPTSGSIQVKSLHGSAGSGQSGVQVVPKPPVRGWTPQQVVRGFLTASASDVGRLSIAREYLTSGKHGYASKWRPGWQATIVDPLAVKNQGPIGPRQVTQPGGGPQQQYVEVTGKRVTTLVTAGRYQAGSIVVDPPATKYRFALTQVDGQWRISNILRDGKQADPSLLLLSRQDFERQYQSRDLYFYRAGSGDADVTLVPDPVYLPAQVSNQGIRGLVQTLLHPGLAKNKNWLFGAAVTAFPPGTKLLSAQVAGGVTGIVNLGGAAAKATPSQRQRMAAQLSWSLAHKQPYPSAEPNQITSVVLKINGHVVPQHSQLYNDAVPWGTGGPVYYQQQAGPEGPGVAWLRSKAPKTGSLPLPASLAAQKFQAMAVSAEPFGRAVVAGCRGKTIYLIPQTHPGQVTTADLQAPCVSLSWDRQGYLWAVTTMGVSVIPDVGSNPPAHPSVNPVLTSQLQLGSDGISSLQVAPDGVRAAMLIHSATGSKIWIAAISKYQGQYTYIAQTSSVLRVGTDVSKPSWLTWLDPDHLLVLDRIGSGRTQLYIVPLNGGQSTPIATPHGVESVTASWPMGNGEPSVAVAIAPSPTYPDGTIQVAKSGWPSPDWRQVAKGTTPVFSG
jgi:hypothetical protein